MIGDCQKLLLLTVGLVLLNTATCQSNNNTDASQSTVVWSVSVETVDPSVTKTMPAPTSAPSTHAPAPSTSTTTTTSLPTTAATPKTSTAKTPLSSTTTAATPKTSTAKTPLSSTTTVATTKGTSPTPKPPSVQTQPGTQGATPTSRPPTRPLTLADASMQADVTNTVLALLNETGFSANATDPKVQSVVQMLLNGVNPTDQHLIDLGIIPAPAPAAGTTPPTIVIPGAVAPTVNVVGGGAQLPVQPTPPPSQPSSLGGLPFPQLPGTGTGMPTGMFPNFNGLFPNMFLTATTTPKPSAVDPFASNLSPTNPNAVAPKPSDFLGSGFPNLGTPGGVNPPPASGILESQQQLQKQQQQNSMNSMLPMLMMMNPEMMEMGGENPMLMFMLMQSMQGNQKPAQRPATPGAGMDMSGLGGMGGMGSMGGMGGMGSMGGMGGMGSMGGMSGFGGPVGAMDMMGAGSMPSSMSSSPLGGLSGLPMGGMGSPSGASQTSMMDMMNIINSAPKPSAGGATGAFPPTDLNGMFNGGLTNPLMPSPTGATAGAPGGAPAGDMMANIINMINAPPPTATGGASPTSMDPFLSAPVG